MKRRDFIKGSAIIGASIAAPTILKAASGMLDSKGPQGVPGDQRQQDHGRHAAGIAGICR
jgi:hypothetical protein